MTGNSAIDINLVSKHYGSVQALDSVSLSIADREFFTLLGPSGCGKTTLLRILAGFESVTSGNVALFGKELSSLPPFKRPVNTVFQQYSLFPHMSVRENVLFGLQMKGVDSGTAARRADQMLELVQLSDFAARRPAQLSGGQQQRVALARALAPEPQVLLLDEPLSALDLKLRQSMRSELKQIQQDSGITFVFVTHDQEEALTMSDRIAVMSQGQLQQVGDAEEIYQRPANRFVADFIGDTNFLDATVVAVNQEHARVSLDGGIEMQCLAGQGTNTGERGSICIRPESVALVRRSEAPVSSDTVQVLAGRVAEKVFLGTDTQYTLESANGDQLRARVQNTGAAAEIFDVGDNIGILVNSRQVQFLQS